jgi:hypothetical protein
MATATARKSKTSIEAMPQLATMPERVAVLEVKVTNLDSKIDDIRKGIENNHSAVINTLKDMRDESSAQHAELAGKVKDLEGFKNKWLKYSIGALAFAAGAGWVHAANFPAILKFLGL